MFTFVFKCCIIIYINNPLKGENTVKLFVIIKENGKLCNFYTGLITSLISWNMYEVKILGVLHYSQYDRLGRFTAKEPEKFKTIKEFIYESLPAMNDKGKDVFITRLLKLTGSNQMWVHEKSQIGEHRCPGEK